MGTLFLVLLLIVSVFLMFVVLIQRGRGGGLAGAFGGAGGQSAFGTKAGDLFTWITVWTGIVWVVLAILAGWRLRVENEGPYSGGNDRDTTTEASAGPDAEKKKKADGEEIPVLDDEKKTDDAKKLDDAKPSKTSDKAAPAVKPGEPSGKSTTTPPAKADATPPAKTEPAKTEPAKTEAPKTDSKK